MCVERHLKSLTCLRVSGLSNYQLCLYVMRCREVISYLDPSKKFLLALSPPPSFHSFLEEIHLWFGHVSQGSYFHVCEKFPKLNSKRWTIPLCVHDKEGNLECTG
jgi:hypothetical protein